ncbi:MAG TPA: GxxExxY protein [Gemmatimonadales bacterium]|nr:GxxExxY protein [Gemmatimonadales bacterium]
MIQHEATKNTKDTKERGLVVSHEIIGAAIEVHRHLGPGLFESAYEAALCQELWLRRLGFQRQVPIKIVYKGQLLAAAVRLDLVVEQSVVVEIKAVAELAAIHRSQLLTYLKVSGFGVGLLINFNIRLLRSGIRSVLVG